MKDHGYSLWGEWGEIKLRFIFLKCLVKKLSLESLLIPWQAEYKINSKLPSNSLGVQTDESNAKQSQQQDSEKKCDATTSASAVSSPLFPAPATPAITSPATIRTPEPPEENGSKRPRTPTSQMNHNLAGFPLTDSRTNPNRKSVADYYSLDTLARPGDHSR